MIDVPMTGDVDVNRRLVDVPIPGSNCVQNTGLGKHDAETMRMVEAHSDSVPAVDLPELLLQFTVIVNESLDTLPAQRKYVHGLRHRVSNPEGCP